MSTKKFSELPVGNADLANTQIVGLEPSSVGSATKRNVLFNVSDISGGGNGYTGSQGAQGNVGYTGSQGDTGFTGSASTTPGPLGFTGSQGDIGFTGSQGSISALSVDTPASDSVLDLSKTVHSLSGGNYTLADGTEGQMIYIVPETDAVRGDIYIEVDNLRRWTEIGPPVNHIAYVATANVLPFYWGNSGGETITSMIFVNGAWNTTEN